MRIKKLDVKDLDIELKFPETGEILLFVKRRPEGLTIKTD